MSAKFLVDTSVWSEALRRKKKSIRSEDTFLYQLIANDEEIILIGIILQEVLSGIKNKNLFTELQDILINFPMFEPKPEDYVQAAEINNNLLSKGLTCGTIDLLIASVAINNNFYLLTFDKDFDFIAKNTNLKILTMESYRKIKSKKVP